MIVVRVMHVIKIALSVSELLRFKPRLRNLKYDAHHRHYLAVVEARLPVALLRANHYSLGLVPLNATEHFRLFSAYRSRDSIQVERAERDYADYMELQFGWGENKVVERLEKTRNLLRAYEGGATFAVLVGPKRRNVWPIVDGFHRAALVAAFAQNPNIGVLISYE